MKKAASVAWTREHLLIALNLYCKLPFGLFHHGNPLIMEVAQKMGRSANSLGMKLCNFASLDPVQRARGIKGLSGAARKDHEIWAEFQKHYAILAPESESLLHDLFTKNEGLELDFLHRDKVRLVASRETKTPTGPTETKSLVRVRRGQQFFRQAVLNSYGIRCCISGITIPQLLIASHIKPWGKFPAERLNPRNGLCLSTLHDAAFDDGLITLDEKRRVVLSKRLRSYLPQQSLFHNFVAFEGKVIDPPEKLAEPDEDFLMYHRTKIFSN